MIEEPPAIIELPYLNHPDAWEEPVLFNEIDTPDIPACLLPGILGEFAANLSEAMETPEALSVMTILGVLSTAVAKHFKVSPKEGWEEPVNIYTLIALPPANHKSIVLNYCTKPLIEWEKEQKNLYGQTIKQQYSEHKTQEKIIEALRLKAAKIEDQDEQQKLIKQISKKEASLTDIPVLPQLFVNDITPESLVTLLHEQKGRLAIFSDEGGILETLGGLYSNGAANIDILLKGIDGGEIRIRRKDKNIMINPYLTIVLAVQPAIVQHFSRKKAYTGNGTLERFLYVIPRSKLGYRTHDKLPLSSQLQLDYNNKIKLFLNTFSASEKHPQILKLHPKAYQAWKAFQSAIEIQLRPNHLLSNCLGWGGKICGFALRIAGLLHIAEYEDIMHSHIREETMHQAVELAALLKDHAIAAFGLTDIDEILQDAQEVWKWIMCQKQNSFRQSDLLLAMRNRKLGKSERLKKALHVLKERHLISPPIKLLTRKPTTIYYVHPSLISNS